MSDIFISYSRKDSEQATMLAERLRAKGLTVWIDTDGIAGSTLWSQEIAASIAGCSTFLLLISRSSAASANVLRELLLSMEKERRILPVMLEEVELPQSFEYPLAGVHRVSFHDWAAIMAGLKNPSDRNAHHAGIAQLRKKGFRNISMNMRFALIAITIAAAGYVFFFKPKKVDTTSHSIAVLPFENSSHDSSQNYFASGISQELTDALVKIHLLRVTSPEDIRDYKTATLVPLAAGNELGVDYILSGSVMRKDSSIKISARLLDVRSGEIIWSETYDGKRSDIIPIEIEVPKQIVSALRLALTPYETQQFDKPGTTNAEAHDYYLRAIQRFEDPSPGSMRTMIYLLGEAIQLDPNYADAYGGLAGAYRMIGNLDSAYQMAVKGFTLDPNSAKVNSVLAVVYANRRQVADAIRLAQKGVSLAPNDASSYYRLAMVYEMCDTLFDETITNVEKSILLDPLHLWHYAFLYGAYQRTSGHEADVHNTASRAIPVFTHYLSKNPDAVLPRIWLGIFNENIGNDSDAVRELSIVSENKLLTPHYIVWISDLLLKAGAEGNAIELLRNGLDSPDKMEVLQELQTPSVISLAHDPAVKKLVRGK